MTTKYREIEFIEYQGSKVSDAIQARKIFWTMGPGGSNGDVNTPLFYCCGPCHQSLAQYDIDENGIVKQKRECSTTRKCDYAEMTKLLDWPKGLISELYDQYTTPRSTYIKEDWPFIHRTDTPQQPR